MDWISQLEFIKDEQRFLNELITNYTIPLISAKAYDTSKLTIGNLLKEQKELDVLIARVQDHNNTFEKLLEINND